MNRFKNRYLNIGCGSRFNRDWINIDIQPKDKSVIPCDILNGISFEENHFDVVYHSHVIEHIRKDKVQFFLADCYRILKPGGILRVVAPDLEQITRAYLNCLQKAYEGKPGWDENYDWMMLEMYDQVIREKSGGEIKDFLQRENIENIEFIIKRWGIGAEMIINSSGHKVDRIKRTVDIKNSKGHYKRFNIVKKIKKTNILEFVRKFAGKLILGEEYRQYQNYRTKKIFTESGELHRWMYDKYSLTKLITSSGFENVSIMDSQKSNIENWNLMGLDADIKGRVYKPDSIFIEAYKPSV